ncbi:transporter associated domain-containing protein, partial [Actinotignum timonense]|nr:transporter associated domain-containing protein [Actinotignum timonense]
TLLGLLMVFSAITPGAVRAEYEDGPYETLGGLIMAELGRIPAVGDTVEVDDAQLTVRAMDERRVETVEVKIHE